MSARQKHLLLSLHLGRMRTTPIGGKWGLLGMYSVVTYMGANSLVLTTGGQWVRPYAQRGGGIAGAGIFWWTGRLRAEMAEAIPYVLHHFSCFAVGADPWSARRKHLLLSSIWGEYVPPPSRGFGFVIFLILLQYFYKYKGQRH